MDLRELSGVTDFFVVCTAGSARQISALKDHIESTLSSRGRAVWHTEGTTAPAGSSQGLTQDLHWVLMDCGDVVVHVLNQHARAFYRLEELWADAPRIPVSDRSPTA